MEPLPFTLEQGAERLGGVLAAPILDYPGAAILGVHPVSRRPARRGDEPTGPADLRILPASLGPRIVDGYEEAPFLSTVKAPLEEPPPPFAELVYARRRRWRTRGAPPRFVKV